MDDQEKFERTDNGVWQIHRAFQWLASTEREAAIDAQ